MAYNLIKNENIKSVGEGFIYNHKKTDAKVIYIKNNDRNKVFSVCFRTMPEDNTGVFHILEHCVLAGSKKYPLKEPFNQLDKCTINTYLNAITFADKTIYPIASTNEQDYFKLVDVYLDAVFFPLINEKEGIFLQEGWNFDGNELNGIVYNEMKGAYATPDVIIDFKAKQKLFSEKGYGFDSGGYPEDIPKLSYEQFINSYNKYYSPTNSIIYLYGDLDIEFYLDYLDREYLSRLEKGEEIEIQNSLDLENAITFEGDYYLEDDDLGEKNYIQSTFKLKFSLDEEKNIAFDILADILTENQEGILKKALVDAGICTDVTSYIDDDMINPTFTILIEATDCENLEKYKKILYETIKTINIDKKIVEGSIATNEFYFKENDFGYKPKGLFYNITLLKHMLYGRYDFDAIKFDKIIKNLYTIDYKKLLLENIVENENAVHIILKPTNIKNEANNKEYTKNIEPLLEYQNQIDTPEDIKKIPPLAIEDIEKGIFKIGSKFKKVQDRPFIYNKINTDIIYFNMIFDTSDIAKDYGKYISIFIYLLGKLDTNKYTSTQIEQDINLTIGYSSITNGSISLKNNEFFPTLAVNMRILEEKCFDGFNIINEIFSNTKFDNKNKVKKLIQEFLNRCQLDILKEPKQHCVKRAKSYTSKEHSYLEEVEGIQFYNWLKNLYNNLDNEMDTLIEKFEFIKDRIFNLNTVYFGLGGSASSFGKVEKAIGKFEFLNKNEKIQTYENSLNERQNEAFVISGDVNYNSMVGRFEKAFEYSGSLEVLKRMLNSNYIWEKIRTEGGAYGGEINIDLDGNFIFTSYSDPNIGKTYQNFKNTVQYIKNIDVSADELHLYKIGTINTFEKSLKDYEINQVAMDRYFMGIGEEYLIKRKDEILNTSLEDVKAYLMQFEEGIRNAKICTIGNRTDIDCSKNLFMHIIKID